MFIAQSRYDRIRRMHESEAGRRQAAEERVEQLTVTVSHLNELLAEYRNENTDPTGTVITPKQPTGEEQRLRRLLALSEKARGALDSERSELIRINDHLSRQLRTIAEGSAA